ncbi:hypothetical protein V7654_05605 [Bacillus sp. JJ1609]|uniref:DUF7662 domain-containing protein n=1 Tax=Bacillus sp. JJ1609 TaxID=3122977 RepID=UPI002FFF8C99
MYKYTPLYNFLMSQEQDRIKLTFAEVERIISDQLPASAFKYKAWWANGGHIQANAWLEAKYTVEDVKLGEYVEFVKS